MLKKYPKRTNIYLVDEDLWAWAQYRRKTLGYKTVSEYVFGLIQLDREAEIMKASGSRSKSR